MDQSVVGLKNGAERGGGVTFAVNHTMGEITADARIDVKKTVIEIAAVGVISVALKTTMTDVLGGRIIFKAAAADATPKKDTWPMPSRRGMRFAGASA